MQVPPVPEHRQNNNRGAETSEMSDRPTELPIDTERQLIVDLFEGIDQQSISGRFRRCLNEHFRAGTPLPIQGPQDLFRIAEVHIDPVKYQNLRDGFEFALGVDKTLKQLSKLADIWAEALLAFLDEQSTKQLRQEEKEKISAIVDKALLSDNDGFDNEPGILEHMAPDDALICSATVTRSSDIDMRIRGLVAQRCVPLLRHYRFDPTDRVGKASIAQKLDVLHFLPSFHTHALTGADDPQGNWMEEQYLGNTWETGTACEIARGIAAATPLPLIQYSEKLAEQRIAQEEQKPTLQYSYHGEDSDPDALWSRVPDEQQNLGFSPTMKPIASDALGGFDHSGMLRTVGTLSDVSGGSRTITEICQDPLFNPFPEKIEKDLPLLLQHLKRPEMQRLIEEDLKIDFKQIPLASQIHLLRFLQDADQQIFDELRSLLREYPEDAPAILTSFLACSEDRDAGLMILQLAGHTWAQNVTAVFHAYAELAENAKENAQKLAAWAKEIDPQTHLNASAFYRGLVQRANGALREAYGHALCGEEFAQEDIDHLLQELRQESAQQAASRSFFLSQSALLESNKEVSLRECIDTQAFVLQAFEKAGAKSVLLRSLQKMNRLAPIPKIFWKVDRTPKEYSERYGFDIQDFLKTFSTPDRKQILLEFGPGNGTFREATQNTAGDGYVNLAMCDKLYYPINTLLRRLIDFDKIEQESGPLTEENRLLLCDLLYKVLVIKEGETGLDEFNYDQGVLDALNRDPQSLIDYLKQKGHLLGETSIVPGNGTAFDKGVEYPVKVHKPDDRNFKKACEVLAKQDMQSAYLRNISDIYEVIPAYPPGTIISDFSRIDRLADNQIDAALGVRSTVYKEGDEYRTFMENMTKKLAKDGLYIDDNVRENFGWNYRLADLRKVQDTAGYPLQIILGPGMKNEDYREDQPVPLAVVMTTSKKKLEYIRKNLQTGYSISSLDDLLHRSDYIKTLAEGRTYASLQQPTA